MNWNSRLDVATIRITLLYKSHPGLGRSGYLLWSDTTYDASEHVLGELSKFLNAVLLFNSISWYVLTTGMNCVLMHALIWSDRLSIVTLPFIKVIRSEISRGMTRLVGPSIHCDRPVLNIKVCMQNASVMGLCIAAPSMGNHIAAAHDRVSGENLDSCKERDFHAVEICGKPAL